MSGYAGIVMILNFIVEWLLLLGADRLYGHPAYWGRVVLGAGLGGVYAGACLLSRFSFLAGGAWRFVSLAVMAWIAFGASISGLRRGAVFILLNLALEGIASEFTKESVWFLAAGAVVTVLVCVVGFHDSNRSYVPVEINYAGKSVRMTALKDTGNTLLDPFTGRAVLIVGADVAYTLTGLTPQQLRKPLETMAGAGLPGLRLIPYNTIGNSTGFLLALRMGEVKLGSKKGSYLVAFAPEGLGAKGSYQALTGGVV